MEFEEQMLGFYGCIGLIDTTLVNIRCPYKNPNYARCFNDRKCMYSTNNNVVVDHNGLFIYIAQVTPILTTMLRHLGTQSLIPIGDTFTCDNEYFDNILGYHGYHGHDMYIM